MPQDTINHLCYDCTKWSQRQGMALLFTAVILSMWTIQVIPGECIGFTALIVTKLDKKCIFFSYCFSYCWSDFCFQLETPMSIYMTLYQWDFFIAESRQLSYLCCKRRSRETWLRPVRWKVQIWNHRALGFFLSFDMNSYFLSLGYFLHTYASSSSFMSR